jgi:hypothetical protein
MKKQKFFAVAIFTALVLACLATAALGQMASQEAKETKLANISSQGMGVRWDMSATYSTLTMTVSAPDGRVFQKEFRAGVSPEFALTDKQGERLPDGQYTYELRLTPALSSAAKEKLAKTRARDDEPEDVRATRKRGALSDLERSGSFSILNGAAIVAGAQEESRPRPIG